MSRGQRSALGNIVRVDRCSERFTFEIEDKARQKARTPDGKLLWLTNVDCNLMDAATIIERGKPLADIERIFRVLKRNARAVVQVKVDR